MPVVIKEGFWKNAQNFQADINDNGVRVGVDNVHKQDEKYLWLCSNFNILENIDLAFLIILEYDEMLAC